MQQVLNHIPTYGCNNDSIFYHFVGNFVPPEWRNLTYNFSKSLSKTAKQLLSLIVLSYAGLRLSR